MATTAGGVTLAEYLRTSYRPDVEYIDGELKEKPVPEYLHGVLQVILGAWFRQHRAEWGIGVSVGSRTEVERGRRLPDVVVVWKEDEAEGPLAKPPLIAIEVLSPDDSYADLRARASDLRRMGTENIWLLDPKGRTADVWNGRNWEPATGTRLPAVNAPVYIDFNWLWAELDS